MKIKDLITELNLNNVDQLLTGKVKGGGWTSLGNISWFTWNSNESWNFTFTNGDNSSSIFYDTIFPG